MPTYHTGARMNDHRPLVGIQGTCLRFFDDFLTSDNLLWDFSKDTRTLLMDGHLWLPHHDALPIFAKLFRDYTWLILLHGSISIPSFSVEYMRNYVDDQIDFGPLFTQLIEGLCDRGLVNIVELDDLLQHEKKAEIFKESTNTLYDLVSKDIDYFLPGQRDIDGLFAITNIGDYILSERIALATGRPSLYLEGYQKILSYVGAYERIKDLSCVLSDFLLPSIPIINHYVDLASLNKQDQDRIKASIDSIDEMRASAAGQLFQTITAQILNKKTIDNETIAENIECLRQVLKAQKAIDRIKKITFYAVAASGGIGLIEPITGGISLVASVTAPLIMSYVQKRAWQEMDRNFPGINYLYEVSKDLHRDFVMSPIAKIEDRLSG